ncbi:flagellar basal-body rod protein FlgG [uncultured Tyzzerella sp.]|uniref:flagellar basal-body rod protein FlgG n=1 Tax=uncultured Tyzzerella sp. TaxID=2321398 RepID=UPI0029424669|nr:flagellar basal-body rod protein FlgG [uncultured Tyzzerella sp.]
MMRSLWTAASGMGAQQLNVDTISNNISNVDTNSYKKERLEFKSLLYQTMERASLDESNTGKPVNLQVGLGVRPIATSRMFSQGNLERTEIKTDLAIQGEGFFMVKTGEDEISYTRDGSFKISLGDGENNLVTSEGYYVLNSDGEPISLPESIPVKDIIISENGAVKYMQNGEEQDTGTSIGVVQFANPQGLEAIGGNLYATTAASGEPILETDLESNKSKVLQGFTELSNVNIAEEMVNLIVAQRAYELNSKAITTSDDMLQLANNLKK